MNQRCGLLKDDALLNRDAAHRDGTISGSTAGPSTAIQKPSGALQAHRDAIRRIVEGHRASNPRVVGSVLRGCDNETSDLDVLIDPTPETMLFDIGAIRHELLELLDVPVDVLTPKALPEEIREAVLTQAVPL